MRLRRKKGATVTVLAMWVKLAEAPEPIVIPIRGTTMYSQGDTMTITIDFDDLIRTVGTVEDTL